MRNSSKVSYAAMAVALIALVASMAGAGYAAVKLNGNQIKKGTITSKQLKDGKVKAKDLAPGVVAPPAARTFSDPAAIQVGVNPAFVTVGTLSGLAAGDYAVSGKANVEPTVLGGTATANVICGLFVNGVEVDRSSVQLGQNAADAATLRSALPVQATVAVPANGSVTLGCTKGGAGIEINASQRKLSAILVDLP